MDDTTITRRKRPWKKIAASIAILMIASVVATIALLPQLLGTPPGRRWLLTRANRALAPGGADFQEISLSWTRPTELKGVVLIAPNGDRVIDAPRASLDRSLWRIIREHPRLGTLVLHEPRIAVKRDRDGSVDLVQSLAPILTPNPALDLTIKVDRGRLRFQTSGIDAPFEADRADIVLRFPLGMKPLEFDLALADSKHFGEGTMTLVGWIERGVARPDFQLDVSNRAKENGPPTAWLPIKSEGVRCLISAQATIGRRAGLWKAKGQALAKNLDVRLASVAGDRLRLDALDASWDLSRDATGWDIANVALNVGETRVPVAGDDPNEAISWDRLISGTALKLSGRIDDAIPGKGRHVDISGNIHTALRQARPSPEVIFELGDGRFKATGALRNEELSRETLEQLDIEAAIALKRAECFGMKLGATEIVARNDGAGRTWKIAPIESTLNGGRLRLDPSLGRDSDGRLLLTLGKGTTLDDAEVNDEVSRRVLSYVAPVLEQATRARGKVSIALDRAEFPLEKGIERKTVVEGRVVFRDLEFAAGPLVANLYEAVGKDPGAALLKIDDPVELTIADGRVNQKGLAIPIGKAKIEIAGSVGFDKSLDLLASVPIVPDQAAEKGLLGAIAAGTRVTVPIRGTLSQPRIDREAFKSGLRDMGKGLVDRSAILGLNELFSRLSRPRDPNAPPPPPRLAPEERKELRVERKADRLRRKELRRRGIAPE